MLRLLLILSPLVFVPALMPAVPAAPVPREANKPVYYFPTQVGTRWTYPETEFVVIASEEKDGRFLVTVKMTSSKLAGFTLSQYEVSKDGVFIVSHRLNPDDPPEMYDPPHCMLKLPHKDGNTWETEQDRFWGRKNVATKIETVTVPAGTFRAIRVETGDKIVTWFAPGHWIVKHTYENTHSEMGSFELPK